MRAETKMDLLIVGVLLMGLAATVHVVVPTPDKQRQVQDCARSMGATTDMELVNALDTCARRYNYHLTEEDLP